MSMVTAAAEVSLILSCCLNVPERVKVEAAPFFDPRPALQAYIELDYSKREWIIYLTPLGQKIEDPRKLSWIMAHELCHAVYEDDQSKWGAMSKKARKKAHDKVGRCADEVLRRRFRKR